jgi:hypothetical protein
MGLFDSYDNFLRVYGYGLNDSTTTKTQAYQLERGSVAFHHAAAIALKK